MIQDLKNRIETLQFFDAFAKRFCYVPVLRRVCLRQFGGSYQHAVYLSLGTLGVWLLCFTHFEERLTWNSYASTFHFVKQVPDRVQDNKARFQLFDQFRNTLFGQRNGA